MRKINNLTFNLTAMYIISKINIELSYCYEQIVEIRKTLIEKKE